MKFKYMSNIFIISPLKLTKVFLILQQQNFFIELIFEHLKEEQQRNISVKFGWNLLNCLGYLGTSGAGHLVSLVSQVPTDMKAQCLEYRNWLHYLLTHW